MRCTPGKRWRYIIINAHSTWLPGDPRGFRNHDHRVHSSGDYKAPPPADEHAGLHQYQVERSSKAIRLPRICMSVVGQAIMQNLEKQGHALAILAVNPDHTHFLVELPDDLPTLKKIVGWCKYFATRAARGIVPELSNVELWAEGETYKPVDGESHFHSVVRYIAGGQGTDAWVFKPSEGCAE